MPKQHLIEIEDSLCYKIAVYFISNTSRDIFNHSNQARGNERI